MAHFSSHTILFVVNSSMVLPNKNMGFGPLIPLLIKKLKFRVKYLEHSIEKLLKVILKFYYSILPVEKWQEANENPEFPR